MKIDRMLEMLAGAILGGLQGARQAVAYADTRDNEDPAEGEPEASDDGSENLGPVSVVIDWEGDLLNAEPGNTDPADQLAALMFLGQARRVAAGQETRGRG